MGESATSSAISRQSAAATSPRFATTGTVPEGGTVSHEPLGDALAADGLAPKQPPMPLGRIAAVGRS
jgi:hypothetical protein